MQVDAFSRSVGRQEHLHLRVVSERLLHRQPLLAPDTAVNDDDRPLAAKPGGDALLQVAQRVSVLGKEHQLLVRGGCHRRNRATVGGLRFTDLAWPTGPRKDRVEQAHKLTPLRIPARTADGQRKCFQPLQGLDLGLQLRDGAGGGRLTQDAPLGVFDLLFRRVLEILDVVRVQLRSGKAAGRG